MENENWRVWRVEQPYDEREGGGNPGGGGEHHGERHFYHAAAQPEEQRNIAGDHKEVRRWERKSIINRQLLDAELIRDEGQVLFVYDDANDAPIKAGVTVKGTPTLGVGCNVEFLYPEESIWLLHNRENRAIDALNREFGWFAGLEDVRQRALINLYFNAPEFLTWPYFVASCNDGDWSLAAQDLENTHPWIDQVGLRGYRIANMLRTGVATG